MTVRHGESGRKVYAEKKMFILSKDNTVVASRMAYDRSQVRSIFKKILGVPVKDRLPADCEIRREV